MILNYRLSVFRLMHVSKMLLNELFANMETKSWGWCGRKRDWGETKKTLTRSSLTLIIFTVFTRV